MKATKISYVELNTFKEGDIKIVWTDGSYFLQPAKAEKNPLIYKLVHGIMSIWLNIF